MSASWRHYATPNDAAPSSPWLPRAAGAAGPDFRIRRGGRARDRRGLRAMVVLSRRALSSAADVAGCRNDAHRIRRLCPRIHDHAAEWRPTVQPSLLPRLGNTLLAER